MQIHEFQKYNLTNMQKSYIITDAVCRLCKICKYSEEYIMFEKLKNLFVEELQIDEADITMDAELIKDLGINSIELADLVMLCEEKFDIEIDDEDIHKFVTVGDVVNYLENR